MFALSETILYEAYDNRNNLVSVATSIDMDRQHIGSLLHETSYCWSVGGHSTNIGDNTSVLVGHVALDGLPQGFPFKFEKRKFNG